VGVVHPSRSGMASGINSTFRQIGIAAGIAAFGSVLATDVKGTVVSALRNTPLAPASHRLATALSTGSAGHAMPTAPPRFRGQLAHVTLQAFASSLNALFLIGAIVAFAGAIAAIPLIRQRDFVQAQQGAEAAAHGTPEEVAHAA
jgi:hypothetical protein